MAKPCSQVVHLIAMSSNYNSAPKITYTEASINISGIKINISAAMQRGYALIRATCPLGTTPLVRDFHWSVMKEQIGLRALFR